MSDLSEAVAEGEPLTGDEEAAAVRRAGWRIWLKRLSLAAAVAVMRPGPSSERAVILAPRGGDGEAAAEGRGVHVHRALPPQ